MANTADHRTVTHSSSGHLNLLIGWRNEAAQGDRQGFQNMRYLSDGVFRMVRTALRGPDDGFLKEIGWGTAALLILGMSLALASLAWFLVGLLVN
jgi:hypothetical protein